MTNLRWYIEIYFLHSYQVSKEKRKQHPGCFLFFLLLYSCCYYFCFSSSAMIFSFVGFSSLLSVVQREFILQIWCFFFLNFYLNVPLYLWWCWLNWLICVKENIYYTISFFFFFFISMFSVFIHYLWSTLLTFVRLFLRFFATTKKGQWDYAHYKDLNFSIKKKRWYD
jgi:hypothetical protein